MRSLTAAMIMVITFTSTAIAEETIMWYWTPDNGHEIISYTVDINDNIGTKEMIQYTNALTILANAGGFSNLQEFEALVNRNSIGDIRNFQIVDVITNER